MSIVSNLTDHLISFSHPYPHLVSRVVRHASLSGPTVPRCRRIDRAASFLGYLYIVSQYTVRLMTPCGWRILYFRNSSYSQQPPNLPTAARRNRQCTECGTTAFGRNRMSAESAHFSTFGAETETEAEIRSTSKCNQSSASIGYYTILSAEFFRSSGLLCFRSDDVELTIETFIPIHTNVISRRFPKIFFFFVVATFTPRSSHISNARFMHRLLAVSLAAGRRSAPRDWERYAAICYCASIRY